MSMPVIRLDHKHIFGVQLQMDEDQIIEAYIHNLSARVACVIEQHLEEAGFLHVFRMLGGTNLESALISALLERWRLETHTFHLPCGECTITIDDVALQLSLPIDKPIVIRVVHVGDWSAICHQLLGKVLNKFSDN
ncbi:hypothetical protein J1N35_040172 [Gossypium stocksii]|uniref:Aminotransferase-like plant mobile domain-containing protein n=1 Tax=Gossypium stocksii TaxID=47602 RepID=A0A9D3ZIK5_9ROSI|nr:hypothetical protein J1N35_040172 [Gossypium stocksii]